MLPTRGRGEGSARWRRTASVPRAAPPRYAPSVPELADLRELLDRACERAHPPAASACAIVDREVVHESAHGASPDGAPTRVESVFDVASVTKVAATTLAVARLLNEGALELDGAVARWLPAFGARGKERVTVRELLGHRSGLPAWAPLFLDAREPLARGDFTAARAQVIGAALDAPLGPPGQRVYSDLGFIALGALLEAAAGARLDALVRASLYDPLGLDLGFVDLARPPRWLADRHVLPTGRTRPREPAPGQEHLYSVPPQPPRDHTGEVDDDNAFAMGGVAGHAGLFGTARALAQLGALIARSIDGDDRLGVGDTLRAFAAIDPAHGPARGLGFDRPAAQGSSAGARLGQAGPRGAIGHLGFTGCSLWIDLDRRLSVALLTNRTYPGRQHVEPLRALRPAFHDRLCRAIDGVAAR